MHTTRRTRIHPQGLKSPLEGQVPYRETGASKGSICRHDMLYFLLKASPLRALESTRTSDAPREFSTVTTKCSDQLLFMRPDHILSVVWSTKASRKSFSKVGASVTPAAWIASSISSLRSVIRAHVPCVFILDCKAARAYRRGMLLLPAFSALGVEARTRKVVQRTEGLRLHLP